MRSIGVFRGASHQTLSSQTSSHDGFTAMNRLLARNISGSRLPKTGVMQSSQRTQLRSIRPLESNGYARTNFGGAQNTVVHNALSRVRGGGCVAPKKKGAKRS